MSTIRDLIVLFWRNSVIRWRERRERPAYDYVDHVIERLE